MHWLRLAQQQQQHEECAIDGNCEECGQVDHSGGYGALGKTFESGSRQARNQIFHPPTCTYVLTA